MSDTMELVIKIAGLVLLVAAFVEATRGNYSHATFDLVLAVWNLQ